MSLKRRHAIALLCLVSVSLLYPFIFPSLLAATQSENSSLLKYEVDDVFVGSLKHTVRIHNPTSHRVIGGKLFVPIIRNETARHYIRYNITSSIGQPTISSDDSGNTYACWNDIIIDGKQAFVVEVNYYVFSFSVHYLINSSLTADYNRSSDLYRKYTQSEELIQSSNSKIIWKARNITNGENDVHGKVFKIYNFIITHMQFVVQDEERGALWALENEVGDCSEYSYLFVALCRAAGIPARIQAGFAFRSASETLENGHMWAEYYLENYGWIPVDATWQQFDTIDKRHFSSIKSVPEIIPYANYVFNRTIGPEPVDKQTVLLKPCSPSVFDSGSFAENTIKTIQKIKHVKSALFLGRVLGTPLTFPSEAEKAKQAFLESQIHLQNAIDFLEKRPQLAQSNIAKALESAEEASQRTWMVIIKTFTLFISIPIVIMLIALVFLNRYQTKQKKESSEQAEVSFT